MEATHDSEFVWADWNHVTKLDPDKSLPTDMTYGDVCETGTDAILVGGTTGVTDEPFSGRITLYTAK